MRLFSRPSLEASVSAMQTPPGPPAPPEERPDLPLWNSYVYPLEKTRVRGSSSVSPAAGRQRLYCDAPETRGGGEGAGRRRSLLQSELCVPPPPVFCSGPSENTGPCPSLGSSTLAGRGGRYAFKTRDKLCGRGASGRAGLQVAKVNLSIEY